MIEVRVDIDAMKRVQADVLLSTYMVQAIKAAGIPIDGALITHGIKRGRMEWYREEGLDGDEWIIRWWDDGEPRDRHAPVEARGSGDHKLGSCYTWVRYKNPNQPDEDDEL